MSLFIKATCTYSPIEYPDEIVGMLSMNFSASFFVMPNSLNCLMMFNFSFNFAISLSICSCVFVIIFLQFLTRCAPLLKVNIYFNCACRRNRTTLQPLQAISHSLSRVGFNYFNVLFVSLLTLQIYGFIFT